MVRIAGISGTLAQNARRRAEREQQSHGARSSVSRSTMSTGSTGGGPRLSRQEKELIVLRKLVAKQGEDNVDLKDIDKQVLKWENEEDELSDNLGENPNKGKKKRRKSHNKKDKGKLIIEPDVDPDDHILTYAPRTVGVKGIFFEEYDLGYPCFHELVVNEPCADFAKLNSRLVTYTNEVLSHWKPQKLLIFPKKAFRKFRKTAQHTNICISPFQAIRGWTLLANVALNKTHVDLMDFVSKYTTGMLFESTTALNDEMLDIHAPAEEDFDGCVRLFTEIPHHLKHNVDLRRRLNMMFGGKSGRAAVQHHAFSTDPDGFYSCHRINQEMSLSTNGAIRYVCPEQNAPDWRATIVIASAMDCTFYWKTTTQPVETRHMKFNEAPDAHSYCSGIYAQATVRVDPKKKYYELTSYLDGVKLYIYMEDEKQRGNVKQIDMNLLSEIQNGPNWPTVTKNVLIPKSTTSTPISLRKHSKQSGLSRIYCSEKSELHRIRTRDSAQQNSKFITLFNHYHKTNFEIIGGEPHGTREKPSFDQFGPSRAHQSIDATTGKTFAKFQRENQNTENSVFTYYEHHLDRNLLSANQPSTLLEDIMVAAPEDISFNRPFYYIMTRLHNGKPVVVCTGYFNNTIWVNEEEVKGGGGKGGGKEEDIDRDE